MRQKKQVFQRGALAGLVALGFAFILRLGGLAPFPPEAAIESFIGVVPASIEETAVQQLGELAGLLGLLVATIIALAIYGLLGLVFERYVTESRAPRWLSARERALLYSLVPWLGFGLIVFPVTGNSIFGVASPFAPPGASLIFPGTLLLSQLLFGFVISLGHPLDGLVLATVVGPGESKVEMGGPKSLGRRGFIEKALILGSSLLLTLVSAGTVISGLFEQGSLTSQGGGAVDLQDAPPIFSDSRLAGLVDSEVTSNGSFYRVAIDLFDPSVASQTWSLLVSGAVKNPKTYGLSDVEALPAVDEYNTFECVSNLVNGNLIGNAKWTGVRIADVIGDAGGALPEAKYVVFYSVDGYSVGIPLSKALMSDSILAYGMNDATLPVKHGYPLRAVIPGLYGMMSAKWINKIQVIDSVYMGYWQTRGWTNDAAVNTLAFIMVPSNGSSVNLSENQGSVILGGVAYAGNRGISRVEVSVDGGKTWKDAAIKKPLAALTWTLWAYDWHPDSAGSHDVYARATDGAGQLQTSVATDTFPNGATGYVAVTVKVTS